VWLAWYSLRLPFALNLFPNPLRFFFFEFFDGALKVDYRSRVVPGIGAAPGVEFASFFMCSSIT
jgi:hypothetical protein